MYIYVSYLYYTYNLLNLMFWWKFFFSFIKLYFYLLLIIINNLGRPPKAKSTCTMCNESKHPLNYVLPTKNGKKEFCSVNCLAEFRKEYVKVILLCFLKFITNNNFFNYLWNSFNVKWFNNFKIFIGHLKLNKRYV